MCTLIAAVRAVPSLPLIIAANRDEFIARPATPPFLRSGRQCSRSAQGPTCSGSPAILAPRDDLAGGTWLGLSSNGLFVGVTNRKGNPPDKARQSRGKLVLDALAAPSAAALHAQLAGLDPTAHNPFHLLYADRTSAHLTWSDGAVLHQQHLDPGIHVVTERSFGAGDEHRAELVRGRFDLGDPSPATLGPLLSQHKGDPFAGTCVHLDAFGYGTRSSMILRLGESWADTRMWWAEGRPCETAFVEQEGLLRDLAA